MTRRARRFPVQPPGSPSGPASLAGMTVASRQWVVTGYTLAPGIAGPTALSTALRGVLPSDAGAAGDATSAASQLGSSIGAALLNTIAATAAASYLADHRAASTATAIVHGFTIAVIWGTTILLLAAIPSAIPSAIFGHRPCGHVFAERPHSPSATIIAGPVMIGRPGVA